MTVVPEEDENFTQTKKEESKKESEFDNVVNEIVDGRDELDDLDGEDMYNTAFSNKNQAYGAFTFVGDGDNMAADTSKMDSFERVKEYLEEELGTETLNKAYPILRDFGDDILFDEKTELLVKRLSPIINR